MGLLVTRSLPRRSPDRYPVGSTLLFRDGRLFQVVMADRREWVDPTRGNGGGEYKNIRVKIWKPVGRHDL